MRALNCTILNEAGQRLDAATPIRVTCVIDTDVDQIVYGATLASVGRLIFRFPDCSPPGNGAAVVIQAPRQQWSGRIVTPVEPAEEGPVITLARSEAASVFETGPTLLAAARPVPLGAAWRGCSDFRLFQRFLAGEDIKAVLQERIDLGANILRVFGMKENNRGWELIPARQADYGGDLRRFLDSLKGRIRVYFTALADTATLMPLQADQLAFWKVVVDAVRPYASFVALELCNEWNHPTQHIDPHAFTKPPDIVCSRGSGLTDADPASPYWDIAGYSARRDTPPDARGFTNYDPYEFQAEVPMRVPKFAQEGMKPQDYRYAPEIAEQMGRHASMGIGGFFHTDAGIDSVAFSRQERACAEAFFRAIR